jgi:hypothetical protein
MPADDTRPIAAPPADPRGTTGFDASLLSRPEPEPPISAGDIIAGVLSVVWLVLVGGYFLFADPSFAGTGVLGVAMAVVAVFLPVAMIWLAAVTARMARQTRAETRRLQTALDAMRAAYLAQTQGGTVRAPLERKLEEIAAAQKEAASQMARFASRRDAGLSQPSADRKAVLAMPPAASGAEEQPALALGTPAEALRAPLSVEDFIRALDFPESPDDAEGFRALRRGLEDPSTQKLVRAAQDVLTLLSQDGIYMDDLAPDRARPEFWRRFASGERGRGIAALGGVRDRSSLALTGARMRSDTIFRDAAHHFLRQFDKTFAAFEKNASDQDLADFSDTRTARAFMLLGRVTGIFD